MPPENGQSAKEAYLVYLQGEIERLTALMRVVESGGEGLAMEPATGLVGGRSTLESAVRPDSFFGMTTPQATRKYLAMMGMGNPQPPLAIVDALIRGGLDKPENRDVVVKNVYTALKRGREKEFVKVQKEWGLAEWYSDRKLPEENPKAKKRRKGAKRKAPRSPKGVKPETIGSKAAAKLAGFAAFNDFVKNRIAEGMSQAEARAAWRERKAR